MERESGGPVRVSKELVRAYLPSVLAYHRKRPCLRRVAHVRDQSLNGSNSFLPAIATPSGISVCRILIESECCARTSGSRL